MYVMSSGIDVTNREASPHWSAVIEAKGMRRAALHLGFTALTQSYYRISIVWGVSLEPQIQDSHSVRPTFQKSICDINSVTHTYPKRCSLTKLEIREQSLFHFTLKDCKRLCDIPELPGCYWR